MEPGWVALPLVAGLALVHVAGPGLVSAGARSAAAGASVAYIFLHLMPALALREAPDGMNERLFLLIALVGVLGFYGLEHALKRHERGRTADAVFRLHVAAFAGYSLTIGYLMVRREEESLATLLLYAGAMALHFLASDSGLRAGHRTAYARRARWVLAGAVLTGGTLGLLFRAPPFAVDALFALVAGGVLLNVLKEELSDRPNGHFFSFALGALGYGALLMALE